MMDYEKDAGYALSVLVNWFGNAVDIIVTTALLPLNLILGLLFSESVYLVID